jgi:CelD/BcsL family acetyltransferase involved in cellulose biosynthesis
VGETIEWITDLERFRSIAEPWDGLTRYDSTPFALHAWLSAWWYAFSTNRSLQICVLWRGTELGGVFPLCATRGRWEAMANGETPLFRPVARDLDALQRLTEAVIEAAPSQLVVRALPVDDPAFTALEHVSSSRGRWTAVEPVHTSRIADVAGGPAEYWRHINPDRWAAVKRRRRRLEREHPATFQCVEPPRDLERQLQRLLEIEASGWKGRNGTAILCSPEMERFYRTVARSFHAAGSLRISELMLGDRPIAFELQLLHAGRLFALKRGYDEAYRGLGPGMVLQIAVIDHCFELGLEAYELLGEDEPYKRRFATSAREHRVLRAYRRGPVTGVRYVYRRAARPILKQAYRRAVKRLGTDPRRLERVRRRLRRSWRATTT